jgi:hypothetical protein
MSHRDENCLWSWHASSDPSIYGDILIKMLYGIVRIPVHAAIYRAGPKTDRVFWFRHLLVSSDDRLECFQRYIPGDQKQVCLSRRTYWNYPKSFGIPSGRDHRRHFDDAAASTKIDCPQGILVAHFLWLLEPLCKHISIHSHPIYMR